MAAYLKQNQRPRISPSNNREGNRVFLLLFFFFFFFHSVTDNGLNSLRPWNIVLLLLNIHTDEKLHE